MSGLSGLPHTRGPIPLPPRDGLSATYLPFLIPVLPVATPAPDHSPALGQHLGPFDMETLVFCVQGSSVPSRDWAQARQGQGQVHPNISSVRKAPIPSTGGEGASHPPLPRFPARPGRKVAVSLRSCPMSRLWAREFPSPGQGPTCSLDSRPHGLCSWTWLRVKPRHLKSGDGAIDHCVGLSLSSMRVRPLSQR